jgi:ferredoxin-NADP reductase
MSSPVSRGFRHLRRPADPSAAEEGRVPPGQYVTQGFPVLSAGPTPHTPLPEWTFSIRQGGDTLKSWTWPEFQALPVQTVTADIHCVTRWSKLGTVWRGVSVDTLDGYTAERSYSIAAADGEPVAITVERLGDGEVSPYLTGELRAGDQLELRGPIGRWFVWDTSDGGPLLLVAGGSGIVPLRAILRHRQRSGSNVPVRLLYSARTLADVIYHRELDQYRDSVQVSYTLTRSQPPGWTGYSGRVDAAMLAGIAWPASQHPLAFVCGPTRFVETVAQELVALGYPPGRVKTERFGGT